MKKKIKVYILKWLFKKELESIYDVKIRAIGKNAELHIGINLVLSKLYLF